MILSTSPNIMMRTKDGLHPDYGYSTIEQLSTLRSVGFRCFDFNFVDYVRGEDACLRRDDWEAWLSGVAKFAERNGISFYQAHGHMFEVDQARAFGIDEAESWKMLQRSILGAEMLGVQWLVWHAYPDSARRDDTLRMLDRIHAMCLEHHVGMAVENTPGDCVCRDAQALMEILDHYGNVNIGVCWDTGHANLNPAIDQCREIRRLGSRLKALHVADNAGRGDDHLAPYFGNIRWENVLRALKDAGYAGTFNFETHNFVIRIPEENLRLQAVLLLYQIGQKLTEEYNAM